MEPLLRYRAMEAFCRQHAKMDGESASFWLAEADAWKSRCLEEPLEALGSIPGNARIVRNAWLTDDVSIVANPFQFYESNDAHRHRR